MAAVRLAAMQPVSIRCQALSADQGKGWKVPALQTEEGCIVMAAVQATVHGQHHGGCQQT